MGPRLFLVYINGSPNELKSNAKLSTDDTSLFSIENEKNESANALNYDLSQISKWVFNWKMLFNPDPSKPAQEVHPEISLNNIPVERSSYQKHLGLILDEKLNFKQHIDNAISKINKGIAVIKKLRYSLPRKSLITIYKAFLRPLIDYVDIIYDQPQNESFCETPESVQCKVALPITAVIKGSSRKRFIKN